jgi:hypothetical protein
LGSLRLAQQKERGGAAVPGGEDALVVGKGMGEDATNGAAARPVVPAREGRARKESLGEKEGDRDEPEAALGSEGGSAVDEPSSSEPATSVWTLEFEVDLSLHSAVPTGNSSI